MLANTKLTTQLLCCSSWIGQIRYTYEDGIKCYRVPEVPYPRRMPYLRTAMPALPWTSRKVREIIEFDDPDIVHAHGYGLVFVTQILHITRNMGIPDIFTIHGYPEHANNSSFLKFLWQIFVRNKIDPIIRSADLVTCVSSSIREDSRNPSKD